MQYQKYVQGNVRAKRECLTACVHKERFHKMNLKDGLKDKLQFLQAKGRDDKKSSRESRHPIWTEKMPSEVRQSQQAFGGFIYEGIAGWEAERAKGVDLKSLE